jgi:predicted Zn-dependent protease
MQAMRSASPKAPFVTPVYSDEARRLNEAALIAYWRREDVDDAVRLQRKAFAANPLDSEVVGNLAFLQLKDQPPQAEGARQLALHSLALNDPRFPSGRIEDWTAFAIASALTGHEADARNAWFASMALASDLQHQCNNAVRAEAIYGERLRPSVQAMLQRARSSAAYGRCEAALSPRPAVAKRPSAVAPKVPSKAPAKPAPKPAPRSHRTVS